MLVAGADGSSLVDVAGDRGRVLWSSGVDGADIEDVLEVDGTWYAVTSRASESGAATTIDVVTLDDAGPQVASTFDAQASADFAATVTPEAVYVLSNDGSASVLEAAALPGLTDRWTLSVGDETREGHWVQLDGALLGVVHDAEQSSITFFR